MIVLHDGEAMTVSDILDSLVLDDNTPTEIANQARTLSQMLEDYPELDENHAPICKGVSP